MGGICIIPLVPSHNRIHTLIQRFTIKKHEKWGEILIFCYIWAISRFDSSILRAEIREKYNTYGEGVDLTYEKSSVGLYRSWLKYF